MILTHLHIDHFDPKAIEVLPKDIKIYAQNEEDASEVERVMGLQTFLYLMM